MAVTLKDIAQRANVSTTAVSHVLNGRLGTVGVSAAKQEQIRRIARELAYVPNRSARSMVLGRSHTIGVIGSTSMSEEERGCEYIFRVLRGVEAACREHSYNCLFSTSDTEDPSTFTLPQAMSDGSVDGIVLVGYTRREILQRLEPMRKPCVQVGTNIDLGPAVPSFYVDLDAAFAETVKHLQALGHRSIELVLPEGPGPRQLAENFEALHLSHPAVQTRAIILHKETSDTADAQRYAKAAAARMRRDDGPTALIVAPRYYDALIASLYHEGMTCPKNYSLVAFDVGSRVNQYLIPNGQSLSLIVLPAETTGHLAGRYLINEAGNASASAEGDVVQHSCPCHIVFQDSVGPSPRLQADEQDRLMARHRQRQARRADGPGTPPRDDAAADRG